MSARTIHTIGLAALVSISAGLAPGVAHPGDAKEACLQAHREGQELRSVSKVLAARNKFLQCAGSTCPPLVQQDCAAWLSEVQLSIPSVVIAAADAGGRELTNVRVRVDGRPIAERLDGKAIELDPGAYHFRFERQGSEPQQIEVVLQTGVKNHSLSVVLRDVGQPGEPTRAGPPAAAFVLGSVSALAFISFGVFAIAGERRYRELKSDCAPRCDPAGADSVRSSFLAADISLAIAALSGAGATYLFLSRPSLEPKAAPQGRAAAVRIAPALGGLTVTGHF